MKNLKLQKKYSKTIDNIESLWYNRKTHFAGVFIRHYIVGKIQKITQKSGSKYCKYYNTGMLIS